MGDTLAELRQRIQSREVGRCFDLIVLIGQGAQRVSVEPGRHGFVRDVRFILDGKNAFAFIPNAQSLNFYFRKPGMTAGWFTLADVTAAFPEAEVKAIGEASILIADIDQALAVARFIAKVASA